MSKEIKSATSSLPATIADLFEVDNTADDLSGGISGGFAIVSIRGSKWRIKFQGGEEPVVNDEGAPIPFLDVVIVDANPALSKIFYEGKYSEGDAEEPDCSSINGDVPDPGAPNPQAESCAVCPHNVWGSRITENGKKGKACHDLRRVAVVPLGDLVNKDYGGPMLLRVPAASLGDLKTFNNHLRAKGISYRTIAMRLGFDMDASYPKLTYKAVRRLDAEELAIIAEYITSGATKLVLDSADEAPVAEPVEEEVEAEEEEEVTAEEEASDGLDDLGLDDIGSEPAKEKPKPKAVPKKKAAPKKKVAAASTKSEPAKSIDAEMDDILGDLDTLD